MKILWLWPVFFLLMKTGFAQDISVRGVVMEQKLDGSLAPIEFVNVFWQESSHHTTTDSTGYFFIAHGNDDGEKLIFQFLGFEPDTVEVIPGQYLSVVFKEESNILGEVVVAHHKRTTEVSFLDPLQLQNISSEELFKAACCNLSESFETNATVDVSFTDAVTGAKEIQMLGLSGKYSLISQEQMPGVRGLAIPFGLLYTPGPWIESIQITKGAGSVLQGYESMTGQINVELKKPQDQDKFLINGYFNEAYRSEMSVFAKTTVSPMIHGAWMGHINIAPRLHDRNEDGFSDMPKGELFTLVNRWDYHNVKSGWESQLLGQWLSDSKTGGTTSHGENHPGYFKTQIDNDRLQVMGKLGYIFPNKRYTSFGSQWGFTQHDQTANIGDRHYVAKQNSLYGNWIFQSILGDNRHQYVTGLSFKQDVYKEELDHENYDRKEVVPGAFLEYTYKPTENFSLVAGARVDHHNLFGWLFNPRLHLRYAPRETTVFRLSAGRGMRSPFPIAENLGWLASNREWQIGDLYGNNPQLPFGGLKMEKAWNYGLSLTKEFTFDYRSGVIVLDFYRTDFAQRVVADLDISPQQLWIYNLEGPSHANTFQMEAQYEIMKRLDLKVAYKAQESVVFYHEAGLREQIFTPQSRFFINASYVSSVATYKGHWRMNATLHFTGTQRIPDTDTNPSEFKLLQASPGYWLMNGQLTRVFKKGLEVYVGAENIFNFKQDPVILDAEHPQSEYFDSGLIWGPIFGREWYVGFRYSIK